MNHSGWALVAPVMLMTAACSPDGSSNNATANADGGAPSVASLKLPEGSLANSSLEAYMLAAKSYKKTDEFSKSFDDTPLIGRTFKVTIPYVKDETGPGFRYDADKEIATIWVTPDDNLHGDKRGTPSVDYLAIQKTEVFGQPVAESNAFGVTKSVTPVDYSVLGIGDIGEGKYMGVFGRSGVMKDFFLYDAFTKELKRTPDQARAIADGLKMDVEGIITKSETGHAISCAEMTREATITYNYEEHWNECVLSVHLNRIVVSSKSEGIIGDWSGDPAHHGRKRH